MENQKKNSDVTVDVAQQERSNDKCYGLAFRYRYMCVCIYIYIYK